MASLLKVLKSISQLSHLRPRNVSSFEKYFSCTSFRLGNDRDQKRTPGSGRKQGKQTTQNTEEHPSEQGIEGAFPSEGQASKTVGKTKGENSSTAEDKVNIDLALYKEWTNKDISSVKRAEMVLDFLKRQSHPPLHSYADYIRVYTDASGNDSVKPIRCGVGVYCEHLQLEEKMRTNDGLTPSFGEMLGLLAAMKLIHKAEIGGDTGNKKYILMTDSWFTLSSIENPPDEEWGRGVEEIVSYHRKLKRKDVDVVFTWIPSHFCLPGAKHIKDVTGHVNKSTKKEDPDRRINIPTTASYKEQLNNNDGDVEGCGTSEIEINTENKFSEIHGPRGLTHMDKLCQYIQLFKEDYGQHVIVLTTAFYKSKHAHNGLGMTSERSHLNFQEFKSGDNHAYSRKVAYVLAMKYALREVLSKITKVPEGQELFSRLKPKGSDKMKVLVLTNSQEAIQELLHPQERGDVVKKLKKDLGLLKDLNVDVIFSYMSYNWGSPGNDKADKLAKKGQKILKVHELLEDYPENKD